MAGIEARVTQLEQASGNEARIAELEHLRQWIIFGNDRTSDFVDTRKIVPHWSAIKRDLGYTARFWNLKNPLAAVAYRVSGALRRAIDAVKRRLGISAA